MKGNSAQILRKSIILALALVFALSFGVAFSQLGAGLFAKADTATPAYTVDGWSEYGGKSVSLSKGGIVMESGAEAGYTFSNTTEKAYVTNDLSVSFRLKDYIYDESSVATNFFIGLTANDEDFTAEEGSSYGVALISHTDNATFNAWLVKRNKAATAIPGYDNLALVDVEDVKATATGVITVDFHREDNGKWYIWINGIYQIEATAEANAAFDAQTTSHVAIAANDNCGENSTQTAKVEVISIASDVLGKINENSAISKHALHPNFTYEIAENGVVFNSTDMTKDETNGTVDIETAAQDKMAGKLDGAVLSFKRNVVNATGYNTDIGFASYHEPGRFTFWDSWSDPPASVGCFAMRINKDNTVTFLLITRSATEGYASAQRMAMFGGALPVPSNSEGEYIIQLLKIGDNWKVIVNGRNIFSSEEGFQTFLNNTLESINNSPEDISPYFQMGDVKGKTDGYSSTITVKGYGTQRWGKLVDANEGVIGDETDGDLEFLGNEWSNIAPATVDLKINDEGFVLKGRNDETGFNIGMNYKTAITELDGYAVTVKLPETVLQSGGITYGYYGMYIGDATNRNFTEQNCIFVRWSYADTSAASGASVTIIVWDPSIGPKASCDFTIPAKVAEGKTTEVTIRFVYNSDDAAYRIYANGTRVSTPTVEEAATALLAAMDNKYLTVNGSYERAQSGDVPAGAAWVEGEEDKMQEMTIVSIGGKKVVNKAPELVNCIAVDGTATENTVTLTWTKAEYQTGAMDSYSFVPVGYVIDRYNETDEDPEATLTVTGDVDTLTFTDTELEAGSKYFYEVFAVDAAGNRLMTSGIKGVSTLEATKPEKKQGCGSMVGTSAIALSVMAIAGACVVCKKKSK